MWEKHAQAQCTDWKPNKMGGIVTGMHNGYLRLPSPVTHQRTLNLNAQQKELQITDQIKTQGNHDIALYFHLSEYCTDINIEGQICRLTLGEEKVMISFPENLTVQSVHGKWHKDPDQPSLGWISRGYHQRTSITTLIAKTNVTGEQELNTVISWS